MGSGLPNNPVQAVAAYAQTSATGRFQEYTADWFDYIDENDGKMPHTPLLDFGLVNKTKVALFAGLFDSTCPLTVAKWQKDMLGENIAEFNVTPW